MTLAIYVVIFSVLPFLFVACLAAFIPTTFEVEDDVYYAWHEEARVAGWYSIPIIPAAQEEILSVSEEDILEEAEDLGTIDTLVYEAPVREGTIILKPSNVPVVDARALLHREAMIDSEVPMVFDDCGDPKEEYPPIGSDESTFFFWDRYQDTDFCPSCP